MRTAIIITAGWLLLVATGCESPAAGESPLAQELKTLRQEKSQLLRQIEESENQNRRLKKQLGVLTGLKPRVNFDELYDLRKVEITKYTNLYDKDKDGKKEKLIVYLKPTDAQGDVIKVAGTVDVQLWDLNKADNQALLGQWRIEPSKLKKLWFATMLTTNYRLTFGVADIIGDTEAPLTVKTTFTDYLTGRVYEEQKVIKPR